MKIRPVRVAVNDGFVFMPVRMPLSVLFTRMFMLVMFVVVAMQVLVGQFGVVMFMVMALEGQNDD